MAASILASNKHCQAKNPAKKTLPGENPPGEKPCPAKTHQAKNPARRKPLPGENTLLLPAPLAQELLNRRQATGNAFDCLCRGRVRGAAVWGDVLYGQKQQGRIV
jgi:hypothetical protein